MAQSKPKSSARTARGNVTAKRPVKKAAPKAVAKARANKTAPKTIKPTTKTMRAKKATSKAVVSKAASKTAVLKTPVLKTAPQNTPAPKLSLKAIHESLGTVETRLKRANAGTKRSVTVLKNTVAALETRMVQLDTDHAKSLDTHIKMLAARLTTAQTDLQSDIQSQLATIRQDSTIDAMGVAVTSALERLDTFEISQSDALVRVNHHLAQMARAIDARFEAQRRAQEDALDQAITRTDNKLSARLEQLENDMADALGQLGEKIGSYAEALHSRGDDDKDTIRAKVNEIAEQTQADLDRLRAGLDVRLDRLELNLAEVETHLNQTKEAIDKAPAMAANTADSAQITELSEHLDHRLNSLATRLDGMEYDLQTTRAAASQNASQPSPVQPMSPAPAPLMPAPAPVPQIVSDGNVVPFAGSVPPNPYADPTAQAQNAVTEKDSHVPIEFDPAQYAQAAPAPVQLGQAQLAPDIVPQPIAPQAAPAPMAVPPQLPPQLPPMGNSGELGTKLVEADTPILPYADPAYAEAGAEMRAERIGSEDTKSSKLKLPGLSALRPGGRTDAKSSGATGMGRNLRLAAMATGIAVLSVIAVKTILGDRGAVDTDPNQAVMGQTLPQTGVQAPALDIQTQPTVGSYNETAALEIDRNQLDTLDAAVAAGDPIAQFQMGLSKLEQGQKSEGAKLVRAAAAQSLPVAQYRLAKLYEFGEGVEKDVVLARQLTEQAAQGGNRIAMHDLGLYFAEGRGGVDADIVKAAHWFQEAANRDVVDSQFNLAVLHEKGQGLPKIIELSAMWYGIAGAQGDQLAQNRYEAMINEILSPAEQSKVARQVAEFQPLPIDEAANGVFKDLPWAKTKTASNRRNSDQVKQVQAYLSDLGYDIGGADGAMGPRTRAAIMEFERINNLPETGRVNDDLIDRLALAAGT